MIKSFLYKKKTQNIMNYSNAKLVLYIKIIGMTVVE